MRADGRPLWGPEVIRRAIDRRTGRHRFRCVTWRHRRVVRQLARRHDARTMRGWLAMLQVRLDPPDNERVCSCEESR